jgi:F-type H+-transporting ATPase subunit epsilon
MKNFKLIITRIDGPIFDGDATSVTLPGEAGEMTILAGHEALITRLKPGTIAVVVNGETKTFPAESGVVEISNSVVTVLL